MPWAVPTADDLARGADLQLSRRPDRGRRAARGRGERRARDGKPVPYARRPLRLRRRRPAGRAPGRRDAGRQGPAIARVCAPTASVRLLDGDGKELAVRKGTLAAGQGAGPEAGHASKLVVLPLPYRSREPRPQGTRRSRRRPSARPALRGRAWPCSPPISLPATAPRRSRSSEQSFHGRDQRQLGFYVLLAACGQNLDAEHVDVLAEHLDEPLAQYLALHTSPVLRKHASQWAVGSGQWNDGFLHHLAGLARPLPALADQQAQSPRRRPPSTADRERALEYVRRNKGTVFGWAPAVPDAGPGRQGHGPRKPSTSPLLADAWPLFEDVAGLAYAARYEQARSLWKAASTTRPASSFRDLYEQTLKEDVLPAIDADFRHGPARRRPRSEPVERAAAARRPRRLDREEATGRRCWPWPGSAGSSTTSRWPTTCSAPPWTASRGDKERLALHAGRRRLPHGDGQLAEADQLLRQLLADPKLAKRADLWRLAARSWPGSATGRPASWSAWRQALDAEYRDLPEVIDLRGGAPRLRTLLDHYQDLAEAMVDAEGAAARRLPGEVVRTADRWRALDRDGTRGLPAGGPHPADAGRAATWSGTT